MAEKEYIEREAAIEALRKALDYCDDKLDIGEFKNGCIGAIRDNIVDIGRVPAADVVEVVRCKDCIFRSRPECAMYYSCNCGEQHTWETNNDFCSYGERKEQE